MSPEFLDDALGYLKRGWSIVPLCPHDHAGCSEQHLAVCKKPGKVPLCRWEAYQERLPGEKELRLWWNRWPRANVGVAFGPVSRLVGLDLDGEEAGPFLASLAPPGLPVPTTLAFRTGKGGRLLYSIPEGCDPPQKTWKDDQGREVLRFQARGGQTVMPPSLHETGREYAWIKGFAPWECELAHCPPWLLDLVAAPDAPAPRPRPDVHERARLYLKGCDPAIAGQMGHNQTFKVACKLIHGFALSVHDAFKLMLDWNTRCEPPWTQAELLRKCEEAHDKGHAPSLIDATSDPLPPRAPQAAAPKLVPRISSTDAAELSRRDLPPLQWAVPNLLPEGGTLLAGRPKGGKSWLVLQIAIALAEGLPILGKLHAPACESLYLALEDGPRRLQGRLNVLCGQGHGPKGLHLATEAPRIKDGCIEAIEDWLTSHPAAKLVIVDTLAKVRDRGRSGSAYDIDYDTVSAFSQLGNRHHVAVVVVHHTRKTKDQEEDPFETISGTLGLSGSADAMIVLKKSIGARDARLHVTGRDIEDQSHTLIWEPEACLWRMHEGSGLPPEQARMIEMLQRANRPMTPLEAAAALQKSHDSVKKLLRRMAEDGLLLCERGKYSAPPLMSPVSPGDVTSEE